MVGEMYPQLRDWFEFDPIFVLPEILLTLVISRVLMTHAGKVGRNFRSKELLYNVQDSAIHKITLILRSLLLFWLEYGAFQSIYLMQFEDLLTLKD